MAIDGTRSACAHAFHKPRTTLGFPDYFSNIYVFWWASEPQPTPFSPCRGYVALMDQPL